MSYDKNTLFIKMEEKAKLSFFFSSYFFIIGCFFRTHKGLCNLSFKNYGVELHIKV